MPGKKMMGYQEGGKVKKKKKKTDKKKELKFSADDGGSISGPISPSRKKVLDGIKANNSKPTPSMKGAMNNTSAPKPPTPPQAAMGAAAPAPMGGMAGGAPKPPMGMGMPPKKPPMPGMKSGGKVKKKAKSKSYGKGGKVRGCGIAKKGVRPAKMR